MVRRTRAKNLYQAVTKLELAPRILFHSSTEMTRIRVVPSVKMMRKAMETGMLAINKNQIG